MLQHREQHGLLGQQCPRLRGSTSYPKTRHHGGKKHGWLFLVPSLLIMGGGTVVQAQNSSFSNSSTPIPILVSNNCPESIWPGVITQYGIGPGTGGFELAPNQSNQLYVSADWQGRLWGRTNCSFNSDGTGPSNLNGVGGTGAACTTGDCFGRLDCVFGGQVPATLAEFTLQGGTYGQQTFYDISLVDGYNIPVGIVYIPSPNLTWIPPNLVNPACIGTAGFLAAPTRTGLTYTNSTYPMPYETSQTNSSVGNWCPWDLQEYPPDQPDNGVYPYPDDSIQRPIFDPCLSACSATRSDEDCCTGGYNDPNICPHSTYSTSAKAVCPDAYSYAFDDQTSTFIIPSGGGWEVVFCPEGRSTNILDTFGPQLRQLGSGGKMTADMLADVMNITYIETHGNGASSARTPNLLPAVFSAGLVAAVLLWLVD